MNIEEVTNIPAAATATIERIQKELYIETREDRLNLDRIDKLATILQKLREPSSRK